MVHTPDKYRLLRWLLICCSTGAVAPTATAGQVQLRQIADGVYMPAGRHHAITRPGREDIANLGVVIGAECIAVIDTGGSVAMGRALRTAIRDLSDKPICYVINTHIHFDHILGNTVFSADQPRFIGHQQLPSALAGSLDFFHTHYAGELEGMTVPAAEETVADTQMISLGGGRVLQLQAWATAHTHSDLTVLDEQSGTLFAGDLVFRERLPVLDGSLSGWLEVMTQLRRIAVQRIVPGHGPVAMNWDIALAAQRRYLQGLRDAVRAAIAQGMFLEQAMTVIGRDEEPHWQVFAAAHRRNISRAFTELEWE